MASKRSPACGVRCSGVCVGNWCDVCRSGACATGTGLLRDVWRSGACATGTVVRQLLLSDTVSVWV